MMNTQNTSDDITNEALLKRLARVEGQIRGISRMLQQGQYCIAVIDQITAARRALDRIGLLVMGRHLDKCLQEGMAAGRGDEMTKEIVDSLDKYLR